MEIRPEEQISGVAPDLCRGYLSVVGLEQNDNDQWDNRFAELRRFQDHFGHCRPTGDMAPFRELAKWAARQREEQGRLSIERLQLLFELGFDFGYHENRWISRFFELIAFKKRHGHCNATRRDDGCWTLGLWVQTQRYSREKLSLDRFRRLQEIGFEWDIIAAQWEERFRELLAFHQEHGHCNVPVGWKKNPPLGSWVSTQRLRRKLLPPERVSRLNAVGFVWARFENRWQQQFQKFKSFHERGETASFPRAELRRIVSWASHQRHNKDRLSPEQISQLDKISFDWAPFATLWEKNLAALADFKKRFGHTLVPQKWRENPALGAWVSMIRSDRGARNFLTPERIELLEALDFDWDYRCLPGSPKSLAQSKTSVPYQNALWNKRFAELESFHKEYGHCCVPAKWPANRALATWVVRQRYHRKILSRERRRRLEELGFQWSRPPRRFARSVRAAASG